MTQTSISANPQRIERLPKGRAGFCCEENCPECLRAYRRGLALLGETHGKSVPVAPRVPRKPRSLRVERGSIDQAAAILGLLPRTIQHLAARGQIVGAAKLGRRWTFDLEKLRRFVRDKERQTWHSAKRPVDVFGAAKPFGAGLRFAAGTSAGRFTQVTRRLRGRHTKQRGSG